MHETAGTGGAGTTWYGRLAVKWLALVLIGEGAPRIETAGAGAETLWWPLQSRVIVIVVIVVPRLHPDVHVHACPHRQRCSLSMPMSLSSTSDSLSSSPPVVTLADRVLAPGGRFRDDDVVLIVSPCSRALRTARKYVKKCQNYLTYLLEM